MPENLIKEFRDSFALYLHDHEEASHVGTTARGVYWITRRGGWFRPCWLTISEYSSGCIRLRTDINPGMPASKWPLEKPQAGGVRAFELTFHESELTKGIHGLIYGCCAIEGFRFESPLFKEAGDVPHYSWTIKGEEHYNGRRKVKTAHAA